jgi:oxaloacetate decarboxylase gamma subunit
MGIVFGFLIILVIAVSLAGKIIHAVGLDKDVLPSGSAGSGIPLQGASATVAAKTTAAITAAVNEYRKTNS